MHHMTFDSYYSFPWLEPCLHPPETNTHADETVSQQEVHLKHYTIKNDITTAMCDIVHRNSLGNLG